MKNPIQQQSIQIRVKHSKDMCPRTDPKGVGGAKQPALPKCRVWT